MEFDDFKMMCFFLDMRSPNYEYIQEPEPKLEQALHPWCAPFNMLVFLNIFSHMFV